MTLMNSKAYLSKAIWLDQMIENKLEQLQSLKSLSMKVTTNFTMDNVGGGGIEKSRMESTIIKVLELEDEIKDDIECMVEIKIDIMKMIKKISSLNDQFLLELRYLSGKSWEDVAATMGYDKRTVIRIHGKAIKEMDNLKEATKCH